MERVFSEVTSSFVLFCGSSHVNPFIGTVDMSYISGRHTKDYDPEFGPVIMTEEENEVAGWTDIHQPYDNIAEKANDVAGISNDKEPERWSRNQKL